IQHFDAGTLHNAALDIPLQLSPGPKSTMRCCIYKERAIVSERIRMALGGNRSNPNPIEVLPIACDECPLGGYTVSGACRGCIAHRCQHACPKDAIEFIDGHAHINKSKCVNCGRCADACPYTAIYKRIRPCENACKIHAIGVDEETGAARIDNQKCISCGACVYQCPFGAIVDKSYLLDTLRLIKDSGCNERYKVYAIVAPAISSQFVGYARTPQIISGLQVLGFYSVVEAALGADMVAWEEAKELAEKKFLTSSCCPAFVRYVQTAFPQMAENISHNPSPMIAVAQFIKRTDPTAKCVFIGPCTAKKREFLEDESHAIDSVLTFEELQALFAARKIELDQLPDGLLDNASYYGRIFARSGGLSEAVAQSIKEQDLDFCAKPIVCDGIEQCRMALLKANKNILPENFIEGMACVGGCIGGAACISHGPKDKGEVDKYGRESLEKTISGAISV
ncbi:MAG: 4Fe-4S dicluster domain-containing protein, partial [Oscillospiraceae bacterium]